MLPHPPPESKIKRAQLFERLLLASGDGPVALYGIGGAGKTQLAVKLAYWFLERDPEFTVIWIDATSVETCADGLRTLAEKCGIVNPQAKSMSDQHFLRSSLVELLRSVRMWFGRAPAGKWLFVFDSADEVDALVAPLVDLGLSLERDDAHNMSIIDCVPAGGKVVFTTKSRAAAAKFSAGNMLEVGRFALDEATRMLEVGVDADLLIGKPTAQGVRQYRTDHASELAEKLDCLPLALSQAAAFMNKNRLSIADYLERMSAPSDEMVAELMTRPQPLEAQIGVPKSIYDTWRLSYEAIRTHNRLAVNVLALMSFLEQNSIFLDLLKAVFCTGPDVKLVDALGELRDYGLIYPGAVADTFTIHRLVQVTTKKWLKESKLDVQWARAALMTIANKFPTPGNIPSWPECAAWLPHASNILQFPLFRTSADQAALATLHLKVGHYYFRTGRWSEARASTEIACNIRTDILGPLETPTLEAKDQFIHIVRQLGLFNLAEATARDVKRYRKRKLGMKNELTLQSYATLGVTLQDQGQFADALRYAEKAMKGFQDLHGATDPLHPNILFSKYRLGASYDLNGDYSKSEAFLSEALEGLNQQGQGETQLASRVLYRLAYLHRNLGNYRKSEESAVASMEMRRKLLGSDHPDTTKAYFSSGWSMQCQGRYKESADVFSTVIEVCKKRIGEHHVYTYTASYFLAESLKGLGEFKRAAELHDQVLTGRKKVLRNNHPDVLMSQVGLASVLLMLGDSKRAEELTLEVYKFLKKEGKIFGERAGIFWMCMSNMGKIHAERAVSARSELEKQTHWKEAIKWAQQLVEGQEAIIGSRHPEAIKASQEFTGYIIASGKQQTANSICDTFANMKT
jgi:tetratricopeptide (TPR) repeat protein